MKCKLIVYASLLIITGNACKKDSLTNTIEFNKSYNVWKDFKTSSNNSYSYEVVTSSWVGYGSETVITVQKGLVVGRDYIRTLSLHNGSGWQIDTVSVWKENGAQLGTHEEGASLSTLDEIYNEARNNWLKKRDDADTHFEAKNNGMISVAGYVPKGCADDCFIGIAIKEIRPL